MCDRRLHISRTLVHPYSACLEPMASSFWVVLLDQFSLQCKATHKVNEHLFIYCRDIATSFSHSEFGNGFLIWRALASKYTLYAVERTRAASILGEA